MQTTPLATPPPQRTSRWPIVALSILGLAAAGISRFQGAPRTLPLDEAIRTLVACPGTHEAELAIAVIGTRAHELVTLLVLHEANGDGSARYASTFLDRVAEAQKERTR